MQEVEKKIEELKAVCADLKKEIGQRQMESKTLKEEFDKRNRQIQKEKKEYDASNEEVEKFKVCSLICNYVMDPLTTFIHVVDLFHFTVDNFALAFMNTTRYFCSFFRVI